MLSCTVNDCNHPRLAKACVSRDKDGSIVYLDVGQPGMTSSCYMTARAARKLFRAGLAMCADIEKEPRACGSKKKHKQYCLRKPKAAPRRP